MKQAVIVTGLCRSGGAAVAEVLHHLGFSMARTMLAPIPPDFRLDWEDEELTSWMAAEVELGHDPFGSLTIRALIEQRLEHARLMGFGSRIGFKSPLLSLGSAADRLELALDADDFEVVVVRTTRAPQGIETSIARQRGADTMWRWNAKIEAAGPVPCDIVMPYECLVAHPEFEVAKLAERLGITDPVAVARAVARVGRPCT